MNYVLPGLVVFVVAASSALGDELPWPQFRGPRGDGHATAVGLPRQWGENQNVAWKTPLDGEGWSSPVLSRTKLWVTSATDDGRTLNVAMLDQASGRVERTVEIFRRETAIPKNAKNSFASPTPVLDEHYLYVHFGTQGTACVEQATGRVVWRNEDLVLEHKEGPGSSPILWNDLLILTCDGLDVQFIAALDKATGRVRWKTPRTGKMHDNPDFRKAYSTPIVATVDGREQLISPGADRVIAYDPADGRELWRVEYKGFSNVPRPVIAHGLLFVTTAFAKPELWAVRLDAPPEAGTRPVAWKAKKQVPQSPSALVVGERLYLLHDRGIFTCLNVADGTEVYAERIGGNFSASPLFADGAIYLFSEEGLGYVVEPGDEYRLLHENSLPGRILASPAAIDGALFVRTDEAMYRLEERRP